MAKTELPEELPGNSYAKRTAPLRERKRNKTEEVEIIEPKRTRKPMRAQAIRKKKSFTQSIAETLVGGDSQNVGSYILQDVLIPAAKSTIQEMITSGIEMLLFPGGARGSSRSRDRDRGTSTVSYGNYYKSRTRDRDEERRPRTRRQVRDKFDLSDIYFRHGDEADEVLNSLIDTLRDFDVVSVADFFDTAGISGATWAHHKYGWTDLDDAFCTHTRNGWTIVLPEPEELDE